MQRRNCCRGIEAECVVVLLTAARLLVTAPRRAVANVVGNINGQEFGVSTLSADIRRLNNATHVDATLNNIPTNISHYLSI